SFAAIPFIPPADVQPQHQPLLAMALIAPIRERPVISPRLIRPGPTESEGENRAVTVQQGKTAEHVMTVKGIYCDKAAEGGQTRALTAEGDQVRIIEDRFAGVRLFTRRRMSATRLVDWFATPTVLAARHHGFALEGKQVNDIKPFGSTLQRNLV